MAKYILPICLAVALCCFVDGATRSDLLGAIGRNGGLVKRESNLKIEEAVKETLAELPSPGKRACAQAEAQAARRDLNLAVVLVENKLRTDAWKRSPAELAVLTQAQLDQEVREEVEAAVSSGLQGHLNAIKQC